MEDIINSQNYDLDHDEDNDDCRWTVPQKQNFLTVKELFLLLFQDLFFRSSHPIILH